MNAIRKIMKPENRMLQIELPDEMDSESDYEVIVLKIDSDSNKKQSEENPFDWNPEDENEKRAWTMIQLKTLENLDNEDYSKWK